MKSASFFLFSALTLMPVSAAIADPLPVIAVNREIGISMAGLFDNSIAGVNHSYIKYPGNSYPLPAYTSHFHERRIGWVPGFQADASSMFSIGAVHNLYASAEFTLGWGNRNYKTGHTGIDADFGPYNYSYGGSGSSRTTYTRGEIGKGFLFLNGRLLLTPFAQGGYNSYMTYYYPIDNAFFVGAGLNADFAVTNRLVLRGRFGWADLLDSRFTSSNLHERSGSSSRWEGGLGLDYRFTQHWHATTGAQYAYTNYGHTDRSANNALRSYTDASSVFQNGVTLHAGIAYQY